MESMDERKCNDDDSSFELRNEHLIRLQTDHLYHLSLDTSTNDLKELFGDVRFICMGGKSDRMKNFAQLMIRELKLNDVDLRDISVKANRFAMYKCGPVISVSHGIGVPSMSILLHELAKLLHYAKVENPVFLRLGTSGGIDVEAGTVVITERALNGMLKEEHQLAILGKMVSRPANADEQLVKEMADCATGMDFPVIRGATMAANDFYEGQARLDGAFCHYSERDKTEFLLKLKEEGVKNIEMEAVAFHAFCTHARIKACVLCVTLLDRLKVPGLLGDQITEPQSTLNEWQLRPQKLAATFIKRRLGQF